MSAWTLLCLGVAIAGWLIASFSSSNALERKRVAEEELRRLAENRLLDFSAKERQEILRHASFILDTAGAPQAALDDAIRSQLATREAGIRRAEEERRRAAEVEERRQKLLALLESSHLSDRLEDYRPDCLSTERETKAEREYRRLHENHLNRIYDNRCAKCQRDDRGYSLDHFAVPKVRGGCFMLTRHDGLHVNNAIPLCSSCNSSKSDRSFMHFFSEEELMRILALNREMTARLNNLDSSAGASRNVRQQPRSKSPAIPSRVQPEAIEGRRKTRRSTGADLPERQPSALLDWTDYDGPQKSLSPAVPEKDEPPQSPSEQTETRDVSGGGVAFDERGFEASRPSGSSALAAARDSSGPMAAASSNRDLANATLPPSSGARQVSQASARGLNRALHGVPLLPDTIHDQRGVVVRAPCLVVEDGERGRRVLTIQPGVTTMGRASSNGIVVGDDGVSREHLKLLRDAGDVVSFEDMGSRNGVFLNDVACVSGILKHGDALRIGRFVFVFWHRT